MNASQKSTSAFLLALFMLLVGTLLLAIGILMGFFAFLPLISGEEIQAGSTIYGMVFFSEAILLFILAWFSFEKYREKPSAEQQPRFSFTGWQIILLGTAGATALAVGYFVEDSPFAWLVLPTLTIPAVSIPIGLLVGLGIQKLPLGERWRIAGTFGLGMTLGPFLLLLIEVSIMFFIFIFFFIFLVSQPNLILKMESVISQIDLAGEDTQALIDLLTPIVLNPIVVISSLVIFAIIVPIVEEVFKPIGVWMFAGNLKSPAHGFALGAISGAAYSLVETFGSSGQTTDWAGLLTVRIGTSILHITSTALMGWGIALAWQNRQYGKLFLIYIGSCTLHGAWNASALLYSFSALAKEIDSTSALGRIQPFTLAFSSLLAVGMVVILISMNRKFVKIDSLSKQQPAIDSRTTEDSA